VRRPRVPFRAGALHSILPTVWLVRRANGQPAGPFHSYAVDGYTARAPHRAPACLHFVCLFFLKITIIMSVILCFFVYLLTIIDSLHLETHQVYELYVRLKELKGFRKTILCMYWGYLPVSFVISTYERLYKIRTGEGAHFF